MSLKPKVKKRQRKKMIEYSVLPLKITDTEVFGEASREELRILIALIEKGGKAESHEELARAAKTTRSRCRAALTLFEEEGIIRLLDGEPTITEEFEERLTRIEIAEESAKNVAKSIRDSGLADMISECQKIMKKSRGLNTNEIKQLTALHEQYGLSPEYIVLLAEHLAENATRISVSAIVNRGLNLQGQGITTLEDLEAYISVEDSERGFIRDFKNIIGIYDRNLTEAEKNIFRKWAKVYGYYTNIINLAWDKIGSRYRKNYVKRVDELITPWYEAGCRTVAECENYYNLYQSEESSEKKEQASTAPKRKREKERYADFDPNDAFMKALERSYGKEEK